MLMLLHCCTVHTSPSSQESTCSQQPLVSQHSLPADYFQLWHPGEECIGEGCRVSESLTLEQLSPNLLLVLIHAKAKGRERRNVIRRSWISCCRHFVPPDSAPIQYRFVIGGKDLSQSVTSQLIEEEEREKDLLIFEDLEDSLRGLTSRTLDMLMYSVQTIQFSYMLKCDDDTFVDVLRIATELQRRRRKERLYWGYMLGLSRPMLYGPYHSSNWTHCTYYFPYACGGGYVLSRDVAELLVANKAHLAQYPAEDMSLGLWLAPYNIERRHDARFDTQSFRRGCKRQFLLSHKVNVWEMPVLFRSLQEEGTYCSLRTEWTNRHYGYVYNWNVPPSSCCQKRSNIP